MQKPMVSDRETNCVPYKRMMQMAVVMKDMKK